MTQPAKSQEPSMEEILASIRRIIADDDATKTQPRPAVEAAHAPPPAPRPAASQPRMPAPPPARPAVPSLRSAPEAMLHESVFEQALAPEVDPGNGGVDDGANSDILDLTESMEARAPEPAPSPPPRPASVATPGFRTIDAQPDVFFDDEPAPAPPSAVAPIKTNIDDFRRPAAEEHVERELVSSSTSAAVDSAFGALASTVLTQGARTVEDLVREMLRPMLKTWLDDNLPGMVERLVRAEIERVSRGRNT